jgi:hypothetical protein
MNRVLLIAFHYPPTRGSSGLQRTLRFAKYLPEFGWEPLVLTVHSSAYPRTGKDDREEAPRARVLRVPALDAKRHLAVGSWYPHWLARPDRWRSWWLAGVPAGLAWIRRYSPRAIWSTYPIPTAHTIAASLARASGLPWIADFRDPMAQPGYPSDPRLWASFKAVEENVVGHASQLVFTTPGARDLYRERYRALASDRFHLIENGYDEEAFAGAGSDRSPLNPGRVTLLHSGIVYPQERDPRPLIEAVALLRSRGVVDESTFRIRFRAPAHGELIRSLAQAAGVGALIETLPSLDYRSALDEMTRADALLLLQAASCNQQIPAKLYEYLRCGRPILALTDPSGDTAGALRKAGCDVIAPLDDAEAIATLFTRFLRDEARATFNLPRPESVAQQSRRSRTGELARLLDATAA